MQVARITLMVLERRIGKKTTTNLHFHFFPPVSFTNYVKMWSCVRKEGENRKS